MRIAGKGHLLGTDVGIAVEPEEIKHSVQLAMPADVALLEANHEVQPTTKFFTEPFNEQLRAQLGAKPLIRHGFE